MTSTESNTFVLWFCTGSAAFSYILTGTGNYSNGARWCTFNLFRRYGTEDRLSTLRSNITIEYRPETKLIVVNTHDSASSVGKVLKPQHMCFVVCDLLAGLFNLHKGADGVSIEMLPYTDDPTLYKYIRKLSSEHMQAVMA